MAPDDHKIRVRFFTPGAKKKITENRDVRRRDFRPVPEHVRHENDSLSQMDEEDDKNENRTRATFPQQQTHRWIGTNRTNFLVTNFSSPPLLPHRPTVGVPDSAHLVPLGPKRTAASPQPADRPDYGRVGGSCACAFHTHRLCQI